MGKGPSFKSKKLSSVHREIEGMTGAKRKPKQVN